MLSLRPLFTRDASDIRFVHSVRSHPEVMKWLHQPPLPWPQADAWIRQSIDHDERSIFIVELEETPIGYAQLTRKDGALELGWALHPDYQGKGLGREAVWAWMAYVARFKKPMLELTVKKENARAVKIYHDFGFKSAGYNNETGVLGYRRFNSLKTAKLTFVGHAGFQLEHGSIRILCDPWFNPAFYGSWTPHPSNSHVKDRLDPTHVYISHAHEDHFDRAYLSTLPKHIGVVVPYWLAQDVRDLGFKNVIPLHHERKTNLLEAGSTLEVTLLADERKLDSALLIEVNGRKILNLNDCHLPLEELPKVDILFCQFSGAFHYPHCYDFPPEVMIDKIHDIKDNYIDRLIQTARECGARLYVPSSGPPWLSDPKLNRSDSIFYRWHQEGVADRFQECQAAEMSPGDELLIGEHLAWIQRPKWFDAILRTQELQERLPVYFNRLNRKHHSLLRERPKSFYLDVGSESFLVHMNGDECVLFDKNDVCDERANYTIKVRPEMMLDILKGGRWDAALLSNKIRLHRDRDVYDSELFQILYRDREEDAGLFYDPCPEMVDRGDGISHQRYCPHQGHDLSFAPMRLDNEEKRVLVQCPRHGWKWDIKTGECVSGGAQPICVKGPP